MKLFDIQGDKVIIHNETLGLPCFRKLWESEKDRSKATDYISYIVFQHKYDSPYVKAYDTESRAKHLKKRYFDDENFELPENVKQCEEEYVRLSHTLFIGLLKNIQSRLETVSQFYENSIRDIPMWDDDTINKFFSSIEKVGKIAVSLDAVEDKIRKDEMSSNSRVVGGSEINAFEIPNRR